MIVGMFLLISCGTSGGAGDRDAIRTASEAPEGFSAVFATTPGNSDCQSRLVDPVDQVELVLVKSLDGVGDYLVPMGKYGVGPDELLRIDCRSGRVLGIVKK